MSFNESTDLWEDFLRSWPLERLKLMRLDEYSTSGDKDCFIYWLEFRLGNYGSIAGGSAFKFGVYSRKNTNSDNGDASLAYDANYGWYAKLGTTAEEAFEKIRSYVIQVAEAARSGRLEDIDGIPLGPTYKWKIAFHYQSLAEPSIACVFVKKPLLSFLGLPANTNTPLSTLYKEAAKQRQSNESIIGFSKRLWQKWVFSNPYEIKLTKSSIRNGYPNINLASAPFPETMYGGSTENEAAEIAHFRTDTGLEFDSDIRGPDATGSGRIRRQLSDYFTDINAKPDEIIVITPDEEGAFFIKRKSVNARSSEVRNTLHEPTPEFKMRTRMSKPPLNQILYGPPGTGKTFHTVDKALEILDPEFLETNRSNRIALKNRFDELRALNRIEFVTFHQSFSYEDFVEGLRASSDENGQIQYDIEDGVFKRICQAAQAKTTIEQQNRIDVSGRRIWKMSLGAAKGDDAYIFDDCIETNQILLGWGDSLDLTNKTTLEQIRAILERSDRPLGPNDYNSVASHTFVNRMQKGDLIVVSDGNHKFRAIAEISGDYQYLANRDQDNYRQSRAVRWLRVYSPSLPASHLLNVAFSQMTLYELRAPSIDMTKLDALINSESRSLDNGNSIYPGMKIGGYDILDVTKDIVRLQKPNGSKLAFDIQLIEELAQLVRHNKISIIDIREKHVFEKTDVNLEKYLVGGYPTILASLVETLVADKKSTYDGEAKQSVKLDSWVLIIDEINRGNIANVFGELITLIEPSKRLGADEAIETMLPYSKEKLGVPESLHIIGTMNTADRSLVHMDTALRRRFSFEAMLPDSRVLEAAGIGTVDGIDIIKMFNTLNKRIELLYDKEHTLGHAFFLPLATDATLDCLAGIFKRQVMPLLEEYFFEDWSKIRQVLGDDQKAKDSDCFVIPAYRKEDIAELFKMDVAEGLHEKAFTRNPNAFDLASAYMGIYMTSPQN